MNKQNIKQNEAMVKLYEVMMGPIHHSVYRIKKKLKNLKKGMEKTRFSYGNANADKIFYLIKSDAEYCGIFSLIFTNVIPSLMITDKKKWIPIIDYQNTIYMPMLQDEGEYQRCNPWEYYFEQPGGHYSLEEIYSSAKVEVFNRYKNGMKSPNWNQCMPMEREDLNYFNFLITKYIKPTKEILAKIQNERECLFPQDMKVMGVAIRADYRRAALIGDPIIKGHPVIESCQYYISRIEELLNKWGYDRFFLSCDDREFVNEMEAYFGNKCCHLKRSYGHYFKNGSPVQDIGELNEEWQDISVKQKNIEYIVEIYLLSMCESAYITIGGGAQFAYILNGGRYKNIEISFNGVY